GRPLNANASTHPGIRLTVDEPDENGRPSPVAVPAYVLYALMIGPITLWNVPLTLMPYQGRPYEANALKLFCIGSLTRQNGKITAVAWPVMVRNADSGTCARTAQTSVSLRPLLIPPWRNRL